MKESWAVAVQWLIVNQRYPGYTASGIADASFNTIINRGESVYTPFFIDLIDNTNQGLTNTAVAFDDVTGYTAAEIESVLENCRNLNDVVEELEADFNNPSEGRLQNLATQYNDFVWSR